MKIGWLVWENVDDRYPKLYDYEPSSFWYHRKIQIVYAEVIE